MKKFLAHITSIEEIEVEREAKSQVVLAGGRRMAKETPEQKVCDSFDEAKAFSLCLLWAKAEQARTSMEYYGRKAKALGEKPAYAGEKMWV